MSLIASLPYDLALDIGRRVEGIRWRTYFTKHVLRDIPYEVESINQQREYLQSWGHAERYSSAATSDEVLGEWYEQHSRYEIIPPYKRIGIHLWLEQDVFLCWVLDEDGDWIVEADKRRLPARDRYW